MPNIESKICRINNCGKPFAPLEDGRTIPEEDYFRACKKHQKELLAAYKKLRSGE